MPRNESKLICVSLVNSLLWMERYNYCKYSESPKKRVQNYNFNEFYRRKLFFLLNDLCASFFLIENVTRWLLKIPFLKYSMKQNMSSNLFTICFGNLCMTADILKINIFTAIYLPPRYGNRRIFMQETSFFEALAPNEFILTFS